MCASVPPPFQYRQTVLAGFVAVSEPTVASGATPPPPHAWPMTVLSLGVGTKFLPAAATAASLAAGAAAGTEEGAAPVAAAWPLASRVADMHAEALARRALRTFLQREVTRCVAAAAATAGHDVATPPSQAPLPCSRRAVISARRSSDMVMPTISLETASVNFGSVE